MEKYLPPDYLIIGHILKDNTPAGAILGGTCSYSGLTAHRLQQRTAAFTSYGPDLPSLAPLKGIEIKAVPAPQSTTFENTYIDGVRHQKWFNGSSPLLFDTLPQQWRTAPIIHLAPMAQEMSPALCGKFPASLVCVTMQGWLRGQDAEQNVIYQPHPNLEDWLPHINILVLSLADVQDDRATLEHFLNTVQLGVETLGADGCRVYDKGNTIHIPVEPVEEVDPTGAGDIFAAAFFVRYHQTRDAVKAAQFANTCASLSVSKKGMDSVPELIDIEAYLGKS